MSPIRNPLSRRDWLRLTTAGFLGASVSGLPEMLAAAGPKRRRSCIVMWMDGGPSQTDTFDLKPGHANGGPFKEIATAAPGLKISEHLPKLARFGKRLAVVRSMTTREGEHGRAAHVLHTGHPPEGEIQYPPLGALVARELASEEDALPPFVCLAPDRNASPAAYGPGFLGPRYAPLVVGDANAVRPGPDGYERALHVANLRPPGEVPPAHADARIGLLEELEKEFVAGHPGAGPRSHQAAYARAVRLMRTPAGRAFNLEDEKPAVRDAYGRNLFGQACLLARRLVERGVPFVEVTLGGLNGGAFGWDTHAGNFPTVKSLCGVLDPAWSMLMQELQERGLLDTTLIVWMGEFGRTPRINAQQGRDHFPSAWSTVLAGGGIKGGQAVGSTGKDGLRVTDRPVTVPDFLGTICQALGLDPARKNRSNVGRPIRIVDKEAKPIKEVLA